jgi:hypothetical protein
MSLAEEIKKLEDLRWNGTLTDEEFARAKAALIGKLEDQAEPGHRGEAAGAVASQLAEVRYQNELARIDREWEIEKEKYMVTGKHGVRHLPTKGQGMAVAIMIGVFGAFWTIMAFSITSGAPDEGPFNLVKVFFPLFGIAFTVFGVYMGIHTMRKAEEYNRALAAYQERRAAVKPVDSRSGERGA